MLKILILYNEFVQIGETKGNRITLSILFIIFLIKFIYKPIYNTTQHFQMVLNFVVSIIFYSSQNRIKLLYS